MLVLGITFGTVYINAEVGADWKKSRKDMYLTEPMFEILGMLDEYFGRFDPYTGRLNPDLIESFYPHEGKQADRLEELLRVHAALTGTDKDWEREIGSQGHIFFHSQYLAKVINSFYVKVEKIDSTLNPAIFDHATQEEMLRFLQGAYARFGLEDKSSAIMMVNANYKIETIAMVLKKLGCTDVVIYELRGLPSQYQVYFNPTSLVKKKLGIETVVLEPRNDRFNYPDWRVYQRIKKP